MLLMHLFTAMWFNNQNAITNSSTGYPCNLRFKQCGDQKTQVMPALGLKCKLLNSECHE